MICFMRLVASTFVRSNGEVQPENNRHASSSHAGRAPLQLDTPSLLRSYLWLRVVGRACKIYHDDWFISDNPCVMALREGGDFAWPYFHFRAISHHDVYPTGNVVLEMWRFAPLRPRDGLHVL